jgi:GTPase
VLENRPWNKRGKMPVREGYRSGFVCIAGKPNVGKSTLLNSFVKQKIAIVSDKPETTRDSILGIATQDNSQIMFVDTPGMHKPHLLLGKVMLNKASNAILGADIILFLVEASSGITDADNIVLQRIKESQKPAIVAINKIDAVSKSRVLPIIDDLKSEYAFSEFIPISALTGENIELLREKVLEILPTGPRHYEDGQITDKDDIFLTSEIIREKALFLTRDEIPHSVAVSVEKFSKRKDKDIIDIEAVIYIERESQKGILVGEKGSMIKEISTLSRHELEDRFKTKVFLQVWVKVLQNWRKSEHALRRLGIGF